MCSEQFKTSGFQCKSGYQYNLYPWIPTATLLALSSGFGLLQGAAIHAKHGLMNCFKRLSKRWHQSSCDALDDHHAFTDEDGDPIELEDVPMSRLPNAVVFQKNAILSMYYRIVGDQPVRCEANIVAAQPNSVKDYQTFFGLRSPA